MTAPPATLPTPDVVVWQTVDQQNVTCNLGCAHRDVPVLRKFVLSVVEQRPVADLFAQEYGMPGVPRTGRRAVDQFGDEWTQDWDGAPNDSPGYWHDTAGGWAEPGTHSAPRDTTNGWLPAEPYRA